MKRSKCSNNYYKIYYCYRHYIIIYSVIPSSLVYLDFVTVSLVLFTFHNSLLNIYFERVLRVQHPSEAGS